MKYIEDLKEVLGKELEKFAKQGDVSINTLEKIHKLSDTYKNLCKIEMLEEDHGESYDGESSYRRGRGHYAKRDSMGRYSRDPGYSEDGHMDMHHPRYSYDGAKDHMISQLGEMMEGADPKEREALKECMRALERA